MNEEWRDVCGYEHLYQVSNTGKVKRLNSEVIHRNGIVSKYKERILKPDIVNGGYLRVTLSKNNNQKRFQIHRLVAIHFIENTNNKPCVNHIDGNPSNNIVSNLEWCTQSENERHSYDILGKINSNRKLSMDEAREIRAKAKKGKESNIKYLCEKYNISRRSLGSIINNVHYVETT